MGSHTERLLVGRSFYQLASTSPSAVALSDHMDMLGVLCGLTPVTGFVGFIAFASSSLFFTWLMYAKVMRADLDFEAQTELWKEGALAATATFLLSWIALFTLMHDHSK